MIKQAAKLAFIFLAMGAFFRFLGKPKDPLSEFPWIDLSQKGETVVIDPEDGRSYHIVLVFPDELEERLGAPLNDPDLRLGIEYGNTHYVADQYLTSVNAWIDRRTGFNIWNRRYGELHNDPGPVKITVERPSRKFSEVKVYVQYANQ